MYNFQTSEFGISAEGFHFLRSGFNYKTEAFSNIEKMVIKRGHEIQNWILSLVIGLLLIGVSLYLIVTLVLMFNSENVHVIYVERIILPLFPLLVGGYLVYVGLRRSVIIQIQFIRGGRRNYSLLELEKKNQLQDFIKYLNQVIPDYKIKIEI